VTPADTRAIVIGIEEHSYRAHGVAGPAADACRFVAWLLDRGVPLDNISVLANALDGNYAELNRLVPGRYGQPTTESVGTLFRTLEHKPAGDLIVYWTGHGYQDGVGGQHLLTPTANGGMSPLPVTRLSAWLASERVPFPNQLLIFDACRQHGDSFGVTDNAVEFPSAMRAHGRRQSIIQAAAVGAKAAVIATERTGVFTKFLLKELYALPTTAWLPDVHTLARALGDNEDDRLAPVTVTWADPEGNQTTMVTGDKSTDGTTPGDRVRRELDPRRVTELLLAVPALEKPKHRREFATAIRRKYGNLIALRETASVVDIVQELAQTTDGWHRLRDVVEELFHVFFDRSNGVRALKDYLDSMLDSDDDCR
jgi:hypothetical protein